MQDALKKADQEWQKAELIQRTMKTEELTTKQLQAIRIAVAEAAGWKLLRWTSKKGNQCSGWKSPQGEQCVNPLAMPNYPTDLNAVHEVEKAMRREQGIKFRHILARNSDGPPASHLTAEAAMCHATATERCIALLLTIAPDKWEVIRANP